MIKNVFFWGAKYKAGIVYDLINNNKITKNTKNLSLKYIFDPNLEKPSFSSKALFTNKKEKLNDFLKKSEFFVTCIGSEYGEARYLISKELEKKKLKPLEIISKNAYIDNKKLIGKGSQLFPGSVIHYKAKIGDYCILNTCSILEHDCEIGNGVHLMPGSVVGGNVRIGNFVTVGLNATIMPKVNIGDGAFIGAGAVVTKDVGRNEIVIGNPAKFLKLSNHKVDLSFFE
tara:strand:- start:135 stop:821 length:687 start_codon:yes stop_codon:yes gene_type:complete